MLTDLLWYHINYGVSFESFDDSDEVGCEDVSACCTESSLTDFSFSLSLETQHLQIRELKEASQYQ